MVSAGVSYIYVDTDSARAKAFFEPYADNYQAMAGREFSKHIMNPSIAKMVKLKQMRTMDLAYCGTPEEVASGILSASEAVGGLERMMCYFDLGGLPADRVRSSMQLFAEHVAPIVRAQDRAVLLDAA